MQVHCVRKQFKAHHASCMLIMWLTPIWQQNVHQHVTRMYACMSCIRFVAFCIRFACPFDFISLFIVIAFMHALACVAFCCANHSIALWRLFPSTFVGSGALSVVMSYIIYYIKTATSAMRLAMRSIVMRTYSSEVNLIQAAAVLVVPLTGICKLVVCMGNRTTCNDEATANI